MTFERPRPYLGLHGQGDDPDCRLAPLVAADVVLTFATSPIAVAIGIMLWGRHMGFTQGMLTTFVAETTHAELRGTAFGMFNLVCDLALLAASVVAEMLWDTAAPEAMFLTSASFVILTVLGLLRVRGRLGKSAVSRTL